MHTCDNSEIGQMAIYGANEQDGGSDVIVEDSISGTIRFTCVRAKDSLEGIVNLIESIHDMPADVPVLTVSIIDSLSPNTQGTFDSNKRVIRIASTSPIRHLTFVHELGHALDWFAFGGGRCWGSESDNSPLRGVIAAFLGTSAGRKLLAINRSDAIATYLLQPREIWARNYAQYIAMQTVEGRLRNDLDVRAKASQLTPYPYTVSEAEFGDIARAITDLLGDIGWLINES
jgi:hypothetical protein